MRGDHDEDDARVEQMMNDDERQYKWAMGNWALDALMSYVVEMAEVGLKQARVGAHAEAVMDAASATQRPLCQKMSQPAQPMTRGATAHGGAEHGRMRASSARRSRLSYTSPFSPAPLWLQKFPSAP